MNRHTETDTSPQQIIHLWIGDILSTGSDHPPRTDHPPCRDHLPCTDSWGRSRPCHLAPQPTTPPTGCHSYESQLQKSPTHIRLFTKSHRLFHRSTDVCQPNVRTLFCKSLFLSQHVVWLPMLWTVRRNLTKTITWRPQDHPLVWQTATGLLWQL